MNEYKADLHIHSVLSPCGSLEMSPINIVKKAVDKKLDIIAITDHNSTANLNAFESLKRDDISFLFGMELQTMSETHLIILFDELEDALEFGEIIYKKLPDTKNNPEIFGDQVVVDKDENIIRMEEKLLVQSVEIDINEAVEIVHEMNGIVIASHINRDTYSIISQLGFLPEDSNIDGYEIDSNISITDARKKYGNYPYVRNSDSHYIDDVGKNYTTFFIEKPCVEEIKKAFLNIDRRKIIYDG